MSFLKAEWRNLAIVNYVIDPSLLKRFIPFATELDLWLGKCYISLLGFMFLNKRVLGIKYPFHINFEEANLRFYVKRNVDNIWKRAVVFIKEIVPRSLITIIANSFYNEKYQTLPMDHTWVANTEGLTVEYRWHTNSRWQSFNISALDKAMVTKAGSETEFITEHYWGYAKINSKKSHEYQVTHPGWLVYTVKNLDINVDFGLTYGTTFNFLNDLEPVSATLVKDHL